MTFFDVLKTILVTMIVAVCIIGLSSVLAIGGAAVLTGGDIEDKLEPIIEAQANLHIWGMVVVLLTLPIVRFVAPQARAFGRITAACFAINPIYWGIILATRIPPTIDDHLLMVDPDIMTVVVTSASVVLAGLCGLAFLPLLRLLRVNNLT
jgi:hypothetical protein